MGQFPRRYAGNERADVLAGQTAEKRGDPNVSSAALMNLQTSLHYNEIKAVRKQAFRK
jgi:hypothetical protein